MPELPEVETLCRGLAARITGLPVTRVTILDRRISDWPAGTIEQDVVDRRISRMARRGKVVILFLREPGSETGECGSLLIHPKMTGQLVLTCDGTTVVSGGHPTPAMLRPMPNATTRAVFQLGPSCCLYYNDARRFGWIRPAGPDPCRTDPFLARLGPEPMDADFTPAALRQALARHPRAPVNAVLLDQTAVAGIGNIYADEALHRARLHPSRPAGGLGQAESRRLHAAIQEILRAAVSSGGTSFAGYVNEARDRTVTSARRTCSAGRACPATCAARRSSAPRSRAARRTTARSASTAELTHHTVGSPETTRTVSTGNGRHRWRARRCWC